MTKSHLLSGNALKLIAAAAMVVDHAGLMFFPGNLLPRILGRLAYPIFAFMIAEGSKYTRSRKKYFLQLFLLAVVCQIVYFFVDGSLYLSILFTFSLSQLLIFALQALKASPTWKTGTLFAGAVLVVYLLNRIFTIDYGFWGSMVPLFAALPHGTRFDNKYTGIAFLGVGLVLLSVSLGGWQIWSLAALPLLLLYSGKRGKWRMKYFFYIFYPTHLALLQLIAWWIM